MSEKEQIIICSNSGCLSSGGVEVFITFFTEVFSNAELNEKYDVKKGGCHGLCGEGPTVIIGKDKVLYTKINSIKAKEIIEKHLINGEVIEKYLYFDLISKTRIKYFDDIPFFKKQKRRILKNSPFTDPENIDDYINNGGFKALTKVLTDYEPFDVCDLVLKSGLRGRGGGGFYTGEKWKLQADKISQPKYVICNGDEGDPGTFMDKYLLEGDPFRILEGIIIAGYATMSSKGIIFLRKEYNLAIKRIENAINILYENKFLGSSILNKPFDFDINIEYGPGAYISGEETALIASIESRRGNPRVKPPYPVDNGLFNSPTLINNVETFSNISEIINLGVDEYSSLGTEESKGTKIFTLSGSVKNSGLVEMPFGVTLNTLINEIGGGVNKNTFMKAIQIGGASGGIIPESLINEKISFENLKQLEANIGAGGIVVLDNQTCSVELARYYMEFAKDESCGFCVPCREGTQKILKILDKIINGDGEIDDLKKLADISEVMYETSMCGLGKEAINPIINILKYFKDELKEHIIEKKCKSGVCPKLVKYTIIKEKCIGCENCKKNCPVFAISGIKDQYHTIDTEICIRCGMCYKVCQVDAVLRS